ncbi:hypothetical protein [Streptomyces bauhiniae]|uniref:hypothetical protein n=1 Tax=Streptomyces bauhiniae TaxID=2340725 RepID=UPI0035D9DD16
MTGAPLLRVAGSAEEGALTGHTVIESRTTGRQLSALIRPAGPLTGDWRTGRPTLEDLVLAHLRGADAPALTLTEERAA